MTTQSQASKTSQYGDLDNNNNLENNNNNNLENNNNLDNQLENNNNNSLGMMSLVASEMSMIGEIVGAVHDINVRYHGKDTAEQFLSHDIPEFNSQLAELEDILQTQRANYPISNETIEKFIDTLRSEDYPTSDMVVGIPPQQAADLLISICKIMVKNNQN